MRKKVAALLALPLVSAQSAPPPPVVSIPVLPPGGAIKPELVTWAAGPILCAGDAVKPVQAPQPLASSAVFFVGSLSSRPARFDFSIDATGRPLGIRPGGERPSADGSDLGPALAASRFAAGSPKQGCAIWFTPTRAPFDQADVAAVMGYTIFPNSRPPQAAWDRIKPAGTDCFDPVPDVLTRAYPAFKTIPQPPGTLSWSMTGFDIDGKGAPKRVRRVAGSGNAVLDREAVAAIGRSRWEPGARKGCLYPYWRRGEPLQAPDAPEPAAFRPAGATCPDKTDWERPPVYSFPDNYRRRGVEGWAIVAFDVAPWGEIGNARVLAAEPAAAFGESAVRVLRGASKKASERGYAGCVDRVRFVVGPRSKARANNPDATHVEGGDADQGG